MTPSPGLQQPFDAAIIMPTLLRPTLARAMRSIYAQDLAGRIQILLGIDRAEGDRAALDALVAERPDHCHVTVLDLGYSTSIRHGGLHPATDGGALRTILSYAANSRFLAYLDDDNWWAPNHLSTLRRAIAGRAWAHARRWFVDPATRQPLAVDEWESVGPDAGIHAERFGGWVDPNCLMVDALACEPVLRLWRWPLADDRTGRTADRRVFDALRSYPSAPTGAVTVYYTLNVHDSMHAARLARIGRRGPAQATDAPALARAASLHRSGQLAEAEALYRAALAGAPDDPGALQLLGVVRCQRGDAAEGAALLARASALKPADPDILFNLGNALLAAGQPAAAVERLERAVALRPRSAAALNNLANALHKAGRPADAAAAFRRALAIQPDYWEAINNLGAVCRLLEQRAEAEEHLARAIALRPHHAAPRHNLGLLRMDEERWAEAEALFREALSASDRFPDAYADLGRVLLRQEKPEEAAIAFANAARLRPRDPALRLLQGQALEAAGRWAEAAAAFGEAVALDPASTPARLGEARALLRCGRAEEAHARLAAATAGGDVPPALWHGLAVAASEAARPQEAEAAYRQAVAADPDSPAAHCGLGMALLLNGRFAEGWQEYEWRWRVPDWPTRPAAFPEPLWQGEDPAGRTILLTAEQGFGDTLQFARYAPLVAARGARVLLRATRVLAPVLSTLGGVERVLAGDDPLPPFDRHAPLMSLPRLFGTTLDTVPAAVPYLSVPEAAAARWRGRFAADRRPRVGLVWAGHPGHQRDAIRSMAPALLAPLAALADRIAFVSLQTGPAAGAPPPGLGLADLSAELGDFGETAGALAALDLLVAVDTAIVHLAGALGRPAWVMLPAAPDWRWLLERADNPWYPTLRLFRQPRPGDWPGVVAAVVAALGRLRSA